MLRPIRAYMDPGRVALAILTVPGLSLAALVLVLMFV